jgi:hypothetical protein
MPATQHCAITTSKQQAAASLLQAPRCARNPVKNANVTGDARSPLATARAFHQTTGAHLSATSA